MAGRGLTIRTDLPAAELRRLARREKDRAAVARMQAIAGRSRAAAGRGCATGRDGTAGAARCGGALQRRGSGRPAQSAQSGPPVAAGRGAARGTAPAGTGRAGEEEATGSSAPGRCRSCARRSRSAGCGRPPLAYGQADAPARSVAAEGAALASEGGCEGTRGVCKGGLQAALDHARTAHTDKRLTLWWDCRDFRVLPVMRERKDLPHGSTEGSAHRG